MDVSRYKISKEESKRINIVKAICAVLVVFFHSYITNVQFADYQEKLALPFWFEKTEYLISMIIARCAVPAFFIISAVLFFRKRRKYVEVVKEKVRSLMVPYVVWNVVWILVFLVVLSNIPATRPIFSQLWNPFDEGGWVLGLLKMFGIGTDAVANRSLWYLRNLFLFFLISPVVDYIVEKIPRISLAVCILIKILPIPVPLKTSFPWFVIGCALVHLGVTIKKLDKIKMWLLLPLLIASIVGSWWTGREEVLSVCIILMILFMVKISKYILRSPRVEKVVEVIAKYSFMIYVFHEIPRLFFSQLSFRFLPQNGVVLALEYVMIPVVAILISMGLGAIMQKVMPKVYSVVTGGRIKKVEVR